MDKTQNREVQTTKYDPKRLFFGLIPKALFALAGYLSGLASLPFGASPFGIALLASADKNALFVWLGLSVSAFTSFDEVKAVAFFGIYTATLLLRALTRLTFDSPFSKQDGKKSIGELLGILFSEAPAYRVLSAAISAFTLGACLLIGGGFLYYDLFALIISVVAAPISALVFNCYFTKKERRKREKEQVGILLNMISDVIQPGHVYKLDFKEKKEIVDNDITYRKTLTLELEELK